MEPTVHQHGAWPLIARQSATPPRFAALDEKAGVAQVVRAIRSGDAAALAALLSGESLWGGPRPFIVDEELQGTLGSHHAHFPLLFIAAYVGSYGIWNLLAQEALRQKQLQSSLQEDVEGWVLPSIACIAPPEGPAGQMHSKDSARILSDLLDELVRKEAPDHPWLSRCMLLPQEGGDWKGLLAVRPLQRLLDRGLEVWPELVSILVSKGGGFPHDEEPARMALVGSVLADGCCMKEFFAACEKGGDSPQVGSQAFAGLFLGLLKSWLPPDRSVAALRVLMEKGLQPSAPLTPEHWPLHAAARHNNADVVHALLVAKADPFARNSRDLSAMDVARSSRSWAALSALQQGPLGTVCSAVPRHSRLSRFTRLENFERDYDDSVQLRGRPPARRPRARSCNNNTYWPLASPIPSPPLGKPVSRSRRGRPCTLTYQEASAPAPNDGWALSAR